MAWHKKEKTPREIERICAARDIYTLVPDFPVTRRTSVHCLYDPQGNIVRQDQQMWQTLEYLDHMEITKLVFRAPLLQFPLWARIKHTTGHIPRSKKHGED